MLTPLAEVLQSSPPPRMPVEWAKEREATFKAAKKALQKATNLAFPRKRAEFAVMVDMSAAHVGATLQHAAEPWELLNATQQRYSAYDHELLTCVLRICHFHCMLEGRPFTLYTDHKPPQPCLSQGSRTMDGLAEQTPELHHRVHQQHQGPCRSR